MDEVLTYLLLCLSAFGAGVINSIAGGGTLLTFPALVWGLHGYSGSPDQIANQTSTVALVPGSVAGAWGYRRELEGAGHWLLLLLGPSLVGGAVGSLLLTRFPEAFVVVVPWLLLIAALLFLVQPNITRWLPVKGESTLPAPWLCVAVGAFQFVVAVYGGYFGAGIGILMLSALGLMGLSDIHRMNAVKTVLAAVINGVSIIVFVIDGRIVWKFALPMAAASIAGGYTGARVGLRLPKLLVRWTVILLGLGLSAYYFWKQMARPST
jgi:uncharacterized membrane protein YfcA